MLIQKDAKHMKAESLRMIQFESFVNSERCKTPYELGLRINGLRALLIQKDAKRCDWDYSKTTSLRALLIQKDAKHVSLLPPNSVGLRALLIQKDAKLIVL